MSEATLPRVVVVDAGAGNLANLARALSRVGAAPVVTADPAVVASATALVLPGVGAFRPAREALAGALEEALRAALAGGAWLLGVCVGFQLLFASSEEDGETPGLGLLPGRVTRLPGAVPVPHTGWNRLRQVAPHPLLDGIEEGAAAYFVHSYAPQEVPTEAVLASSRHGRAFAAAAGAGRIAGTQFHPEKSGAVGLRLLRNFVRQAAASELAEQGLPALVGERA